jgi:alkylation response protein AidB-like acyl-CoA dehydrogenase
MNSQDIQPNEGLAAVRSILPEVRERADEVEQARQIPADLSASLASLGIYRWWVPKTYGGSELPLPHAVEALEELARADGSVAWCVFIGITSATSVAFIPEAAAREVMSKPETLVGGVFAPMGRAEAVDGGFRVSGQWPFGSGTLNADWVLGGSFFFRDGEQLVDERGAPRQHMVLVPRRDVEFLDTWQVSGLCGTGSTDFRMDGALVPESRIVRWQGGRAEGPLYAFPQLTLLASGFGPIALGLARAALDELTAVASKKTPTGSVRPLAARTETQGALARGEAGYRSARAFLYEAIDAAWNSALETGQVSLEQRRDMRLATSHAVEQATQIIDTMYHLAGSVSIYRKSRLQRIFRDIHVVTQHLMVRPTSFEMAGRAFLGIDKDTELL